MALSDHTVKHGCPPRLTDLQHEQRLSERGQSFRGVISEGLVL